jgi:hypothetical protein
VVRQGENFLVTFKVNYETSLGQSLCVVGSIMQLGCWKKFTAHMKWTEGHVWVLPDVMISDHYFTYKYVVLNNGEPERWEHGNNRIADLPLLKATSGINAYEKSEGTYLCLEDVWDRYTVTFSIYYPCKN